MARHKKPSPAEVEVKKLRHKKLVVLTRKAIDRSRQLIDGSKELIAAVRRKNPARKKPA